MPPDDISSALSDAGDSHSDWRQDLITNKDGSPRAILANAATALRKDPALAAARDQLWAEAVAAFRDGEPWWLDSDELIKAAAAEQEKRYRPDPWQETIETYLEEPIGDTGKPRAETSIDLICRKLGIDPGRRTQQDANRISRCLTKLGWERTRKRKNGARTYVYERPSVPGVPTCNDQRGDEIQQ